MVNLTSFVTLLLLAFLIGIDLASIVDCDGGVATGLHDARLLLPGGVHHHTEEECHAQQISGEN